MPVLTALPPVPCWSTPEVTARLVRDLLLSEMAQLRPSGWSLPPGSPHPGPDAAASDWHWVEELGTDSLELLQLTTALADTLGLNDLTQAQALFEQPTWGHWQAVACAHWARPPERIRFRTSGSTGTPRSCWHALPQLWEEMCAMAAVIGPARRVVSAVRSHHIYGFLFTVLLPHALRPGQPLPVLDLAGLPPIGLGAQLAPGDVVIGFPDWWRAALRATPEWPEGVMGISSTAPCPADLSDACLQAGVQRLLHVYGSSETAGIGWREWPEQAYTLFPHWQRVPGDPQALQRAGLTPEAEPLRAPLQDTLHWVASPDAPAEPGTERCFTPGPRVDGAVQVGGVNVHLGLVQARLAQLPGVQAITLRLADLHGQPRLKAFVVPMSDAPDDLSEQLLAWSRQHLAPAARPVHITLGEALPRNGMGKLCDWPLG
jgi:long-chain acyl-CoA synthetase